MSGSSHGTCGGPERLCQTRSQGRSGAAAACTSAGRLVQLRVVAAAVRAGGGGHRRRDGVRGEDQPGAGAPGRVERRQRGARPRRRAARRSRGGRGTAAAWRSPGRPGRPWRGPRRCPPSTAGRRSSRRTRWWRSRAPRSTPSSRICATVSASIGCQLRLPQYDRQVDAVRGEVGADRGEQVTALLVDRGDAAEVHGSARRPRPAVPPGRPARASRCAGTASRRRGAPGPPKDSRRNASYATVHPAHARRRPDELASGTPVGSTARRQAPRAW